MIREQLRESIVIEALGAGGWGLARLSNGRKVRIPGVSVGERHLVEAFRTFKGWRARSVQCEAAAAVRITSDCAFHGLCGGCTHRHLSEDQRILTLTTDLKSRLRRHGFDEPPVTVVSEVPARDYRNRAVVQPTKASDGQWQLSFSRTPTFEGVHLQDCLIQSPGIRLLCEAVQNALGPEYEAYTPEQNVGSLRHIILATNQLPKEDQCRVTLAFHGPTDISKVERFRRCLSDYSTSFELYIDELPKRNAGLMSNPKLVFSTSTFRPSVGLVSFQVSPRSWWTQTPLSFNGLITTMRRLLDLAAHDRVLEIGCGVGTVPVALDRKDVNWLGIDHERSAIVDAEYNTRHLGDGYAFRVGDGEHWLRKLVGRTGFSVLILHAMRMPFGGSFMKLAGTLKPRVILYVAPNPTALLKDIEQLAAYTLDELVLVDHTPGSGHYLTIALMSQSL